MGIRTYNPYTPSRRNMTGSDFSEITKTTPEKSLLAKKSKTAGRNNQGKITVRHHGGGNRQKYRLIDFKRNKEGVPAKVIGIEYDPNRTANIALICYADGEKAYILAPQGLTDGMTVQNGAGAEVRVGNCLPLTEIPVGTQVHNIELYPGKGLSSLSPRWVDANTTVSCPTSTVTSSNARDSSCAEACGNISFRTPRYGLAVSSPIPYQPPAKAIVLPYNGNIPVRKPSSVAKSLPC